jgi:hypothetical protein
MDRVDEPFFRAAVELLGEGMRWCARRGRCSRCRAAGRFAEVARGRRSRSLLRPGPSSPPRKASLSWTCGRRAGGGGATARPWTDERPPRAAGVTLFAADGGPGEARVVLTCRPLPLRRGDPCPFSSTCRPRPRCGRSGTPMRCSAPPPAEVTWWYSRGALPPRAFAPADVRDGTRGLRRAGLVRLRIPPDWAPGGPAVGGLLPFALILRTAAARFTFPVKVRRIVPNAAVAVHRRLARETRHVTAWLPLPGLALTLEEASAPPYRRRSASGSASSTAAGIAGVRCTTRAPAPPTVSSASTASGGASSSATGSPDASPAPTRPWTRTCGSRSRRGRERAATWERASRGREWPPTSGRPGPSPQWAAARPRRSTRPGCGSGVLERVERAVTAADHVRLAETTPGSRSPGRTRPWASTRGTPCRVVAGPSPCSWCRGHPAARASSRPSAWARRCRTRAPSPPCARTWRGRAWWAPRCGSARRGTARCAWPCACSATPPTRRPRARASTPRCAGSSTRSRAATSARGGPSATRSGRPCSCARRAPRSRTARSSRSRSASTAPPPPRTARRCRSARTTSPRSRTCP